VEEEKTNHFTKLDEMIEEHAHEDIQKCWTEFLKGIKDFGEPLPDFNEQLEGREFKEWMQIHKEDALSDDEFDFDWY